MNIQWINLERPGYFGKRRDAIINQLNRQYSPSGWRLVWILDEEYGPRVFEDACVLFYEQSYIAYFSEHQEDLDFICSFGECIDNSLTNIGSGLDYTKQEAYSTHIQDIAIRRTLQWFGKSFTGTRNKILTVRSSDSNGHRFGPGNIPFLAPEKIIQPSLRPRWAHPNSVEDFWQSNKYIQIRKRQGEQE